MNVYNIKTRVRWKSVIQATHDKVAVYKTQASLLSSQERCPVGAAAGADSVGRVGKSRACSGAFRRQWARRPACQGGRTCPLRQLEGCLGVSWGQTKERGPHLRTARRTGRFD